MPETIGVLFVQSQEGFGADTAVHAHLMRHLDRNRFSVHVACTAGSGEGTPQSLVELQRLPDVKLRVTRFMPGVRERTLSKIASSVPDGIRAPLDLMKLRQYVKNEGIRIIHSSERPRDSLYAIGLSRLTGAKSVVHVHVKWSKIYSTPALWGVDNADAIFSISKYVTSTLVDMGRDPRTIHTILNCADPAAWNPAVDGSALRRELAIPADASVLSSVSRLFSWKGQRELLRAFARVVEQAPNTILLIVGADAPHEGASFTAELRRIAIDLGVEHLVRFTGGRSDIPQVLAASDVFTMPSFEEPFGLVFLEAMAMQKPVVALDNGGTPEVVVHGETGLLSSPWDIPELADNILRLLRDPALRARMGHQGRERMLRYFTPDRMAAEAGSAYERILTG